MFPSEIFPLVYGRGCKIVKFLIAGSGSREGIFASRLTEDSRLYAVMGHENPTIARCVKETGGAYIVADPNDPGVVSRFAREHDVDYAFVNADQALCNGVVDRLMRDGLRAVGGTRDATRVEWDKVYAMEMVRDVAPEFSPFHVVVSSQEELEDSMSSFRTRGLQMAVKPQGLTGGKGVKVMPEHLASYADCTEYASSILQRGESVLLVERLDGPEFTIMGLTDGKNMVLAPATYDYPYRYEGDRGPGTGGMGCFAGPSKILPFMSGDDLDDCRNIMQRVIDETRARGHRFSGVLNGGFFKTRQGIRFMEFNARFGDPEALNVLLLLEGSFSEIVNRMWDGTLSEDSVSFSGNASVVKYLVAPEYPEASPETVRFMLDEEAASREGVHTYFASCVRRADNEYETLGRSRVAALCAISDGIEEASRIVDSAIDRHVTGPLEYRRDVGSRENLKRLKRS